MSRVFNVKVNLETGELEGKEEDAAEGAAEPEPEAEKKE